ncbi:MAG: hypothetical protein HY960_00815 [Ignavibacteriae bacterium]|nr:hypothetical protein [Ignavibacteriota bacterium]
MNDAVNLFSFQQSQKNKSKLLVLWFLLAIVCLFINYLSGPTIQFPILFVLPVILSSWFNGKYWGFFFAIALPLTQFYFNVRWEVGWDLANVAVNSVIRILVMMMTAYLTDIATKKERLETHVQHLEGLLPICSSCKKIRDESNEWQPLEKYISERSNADFTHGVCPECMEKLYSQYLVKKR